MGFFDFFGGNKGSAPAPAPEQESGGMLGGIMNLAVVAMIVSLIAAFTGGFKEGGWANELFSKIGGALGLGGDEEKQPPETRAGIEGQGEAVAGDPPAKERAAGEVYIPDGFAETFRATAQAAITVDPNSIVSEYVAGRESFGGDWAGKTIGPNHSLGESLLIVSQEGVADLHNSGATGIDDYVPAWASSVDGTLQKAVPAIKQEIAEYDQYEKETRATADDLVANIQIARKELNKLDIGSSRRAELEDILDKAEKSATLKGHAPEIPEDVKNDLIQSFEKGEQTAEYLKTEYGIENAVKLKDALDSNSLSAFALTEAALQVGIDGWDDVANADKHIATMEQLRGRWNSYGKEIEAYPEKIDAVTATLAEYNGKLEQYREAAEIEKAADGAKLAGVERRPEDGKVNPPPPGESRETSRGQGA